MASFVELMKKLKERDEAHLAAKFPYASLLGSARDGAGDEKVQQPSRRQEAEAELLNELAAGLAPDEVSRRDAETEDASPQAAAAAEEVFGGFHNEEEDTSVESAVKAVGALETRQEAEAGDGAPPEGEAGDAELIEQVLGESESDAAAVAAMAEVPTEDETPVDAKAVPADEAPPEEAAEHADLVEQVMKEQESEAQAASVIEQPAESGAAPDVEAAAEKEATGEEGMPREEEAPGEKAAEETSADEEVPQEEREESEEALVAKAMTALEEAEAHARGEGVEEDHREPSQEVVAGKAEKEEAAAEEASAEEGPLGEEIEERGAAELAGQEMPESLGGPVDSAQALETPPMRGRETEEAVSESIQAEIADEVGADAAELPDSSGVEQRPAEGAGEAQATSEAADESDDLDVEAILAQVTGESDVSTETEREEIPRQSETPVAVEAEDSSEGEESEKDLSEKDEAALRTLFSSEGESGEAEPAPVDGEEDEKPAAEPEPAYSNAGGPDLGEQELFRRMAAGGSASAGAVSVSVGGKQGSLKESAAAAGEWICRLLQPDLPAPLLWAFGILGVAVIASLAAAVLLEILRG